MDCSRRGLNLGLVGIVAKLHGVDNPLEDGADRSQLVAGYKRYDEVTMANRTADADQEYLEMPAIVARDNPRPKALSGPIRNGYSISDYLLNGIAVAFQFISKVSLDLIGCGDVWIPIEPK